MKKKLFLILSFCLSVTITAWADNGDEQAAAPSTVTVEATEAVEALLAEMNRGGDPMKKRWKYLVAHQDDLSTPDAINLKKWLDRTGNKQMKRGNILFWTSLLWPLVGGVTVSAIGVKDDNEGLRTGIAIASVGAMGVQMVWGLIDQKSARKKLDQSRLIIVQTPIPGATFGNENYQALLGVGLMRDNMSQSYGIGPSLTVNF